MEPSQTRRRRKRRLRAAYCLTTLLLAPRTTSALSAPSNTLSRPKQGVEPSNIVGPIDEEETIDDDDDEPVALIQSQRQEVPPWLKRLENSQQQDVEVDLNWLEYALLEQHFSLDDVNQVVQTLKQASHGDASKLSGMVDFLRLILQLGDDKLVTTKVLQASALHYSDCITARETGVYQVIQDALYGGASTRKRRPLPFQLDSSVSTVCLEESECNPSLKPAPLILRNLVSTTNSHDTEVLRISQGAAQVKRAEILANAVLKVGRIPSKDEAERLRGLLLSVMDDWRSLAIRAVACLYRLEGILYESNDNAVDLKPDVVSMTREALHVYAPLAQRLGMHRLKAKLEDRAFRIIYRRQYNAVSSLYKEGGSEMRSISSSLSSHIEQVLRQTPSLMEQLEELRVTSRVKEPYSLWKKLLKLRSRGSPRLVGSTESSSTSSELSLMDVKDGIAVRIILRARKWSDDEPEETTRARERLLCYYVQHLLYSYWPAVDKTRVKDYIRHPKQNGYQSLHYTSSIANEEGREWPFEVQIRSDEMHRIAEYGVAAHWDYKLAAGKEEPKALPVASDKPEKSYIDALVTARKDLVQQKVFVFFAGMDSAGELLSLPVGAKVDDALDQLQDQIDRDDVCEAASCGSVLRNGRVARGDEYVSNGDVLLITL